MFQQPKLNERSLVSEFTKSETENAASYSVNQKVEKRQAKMGQPSHRILTTLDCSACSFSIILFKSHLSSGLAEGIHGNGLAPFEHLNLAEYVFRWQLGIYHGETWGTDSGILWGVFCTNSKSHWLPISSTPSNNSEWGNISLSQFSI